MKFRKVLLILILPLVLDTIISCCDCPDLPYTNYAQGVMYSHTGILASPIDNSGPQAKALSSDSVPASAFGIRVIVDRQEVQRMARRSGLIQSAYAFSCDCYDERYYIPADTLVSLEIITGNDFDATHPAGSDISEYFLGFDSHSYRTAEEMLELSIWYNEDFEILEFIFLLMNEPDPELGSSHQFTVRLSVSDGRVLEQETDPINLVQ